MLFQTTNRSLLRLAVAGSPEEAREAVSLLCETYWSAVYAFVRLRGHSPADAEDLTQSYFAVLLEKGYLRDFRPEAGRFRTFLRTSIGHFLANAWDRERAKKRGGGRAPIALDAATAEERLRLEPVDRLTPERAFERQWAVAVCARCACWGSCCTSRRPGPGSRAARPSGRRTRLRASCVRRAPASWLRRGRCRLSSSARRRTGFVSPRSGLRSSSQAASCSTTWSSPWAGTPSPTSRSRTCCVPSWQSSRRAWCGSPTPDG